MRYIGLVFAPAMILAALVAVGATEAVAAAPIRIAVFPFELEDFSAGATHVGPDDIDHEQLRLATEEARRLVAASGRYQLVDAGAVNDQAAKSGKLRDCEGCEARIAAGFDADQSMIGIVTRISRTEYTVAYRIRDAKSATLVSVAQTDLRMGANVAWSRGARWLIENRLLQRAQDKPLVFAVAEIHYVDTSGEVIDQSADHRRRLREFEAALRSDLVASGKIANAALECQPNACSVGDISDGQLLGKANEAGATHLVIGRFHKMSTLIQQANFAVIDVKARKVVFDRHISFRGDNDAAWQRAESFLARQILEQGEW